MAQPQAYNRETDFTERDGDDTNHPGINIELDAAAQSINEIRDNLALIQRDDGALQNGIVTAESLAPTAFDAFKGDLNEAVADAQTAATSANNAAVSANTARDTAVAAKDTAVTSANAAALNATTATTKAAESSASATASQTSATASANSATASQTSRLASEAARDAAQAAQAAASASQTATATSEANASASAATATAQAGIATTQAGIATTQATSAAASATAAAASLDSFDDRYLGSKTADPTTDNDGNALVTGAQYFNSVAGEMRVWAGTFWKATGSSVGGTINTAKYTATAGQTTFAIVYDVGFVHVYLNGVKLESGVEFTANNGTSVVLATGATAGDVVDMIAFGIFSVANTYTKAEADALLAPKANTVDVNTALAAKANQATTYTKTEVDTALSGKQASLGFTPVNKAGDTMTGQLVVQSEVGLFVDRAGSSFGGSVRVRNSNRDWTAGLLGAVGASAYEIYDNTAGAVRLSLDTSGNLKFNSGYGSVADVYGCRAWVNFNGTGTVAIRGSGNVSSITDNGTGDYRVNFTTAMPDRNYAALSTGGGGWQSSNVVDYADLLTGSVRIQCFDNSNYTKYDKDIFSVAIIR